MLRFSVIQASRVQWAQGPLLKPRITDDIFYYKINSVVVSKVTAQKVLQMRKIKSKVKGIV